MGRVTGFCRRTRGRVRYLLDFNGELAEVSLSDLRVEAGYSLVKSVLHSSSDNEERRFFLTDSTAHEACSDGSFRRIRLLSGKKKLGEWTFAYSGKQRTVLSVGGLHSRVEDYKAQGCVVAPMNGQVVRIFKQNGDLVAAGEVIVIIEAMKMENEVSAPHAGKLSMLSIEPGQAVIPGQQLFSVETEG